MDGPFLMICPMDGRASDFRAYWHKRGMRFAVVTGWVMDGWWKRSYGVDEGFPLSDHADFPELIEFVRGCAPSRVYTTHGFAEELAVSIQDKLGIEAIQLKRKQRSLAEF
jgi:Cft2 family RNA processing exonuclease